MIKRHIGIIIPDLQIHGKSATYPVLNERAIRATAWILFAVGSSVMRYTILTGDPSIMMRVVPAFWWHFVIASLRWPAYSPIARLGKMLVSWQHPEYVWAIQKRFARSIGAVMASIMMILILWVPGAWIRLLIISMIFLTFMWLESAVGLCIGCKLYDALIRRWIIQEPNQRSACPGGACEYHHLLSINYPNNSQIFYISYFFIR